MQIQQDSTAEGLESVKSSLVSDFPFGSFFKAAPGGGFFRLLAFFDFFVVLPLFGDDGAFRFLEGAEAAGERAVGPIDLSRVLVCERFLDLVAGPVNVVSSS